MEVADSDASNGLYSSLSMTCTAIEPIGPARRLIMLRRMLCRSFTSSVDSLFHRGGLESLRSDFLKVSHSGAVQVVPAGAPRVFCFKCRLNFVVAEFVLPFDAPEA